MLNVAAHPPPPRGQDKIEHFVVLFMENRGFDNLLGCMLGDTPGVDGIPSGGRQIPVDSDDPTKGTVNISCGTAKYVCTGGIDYDFFQGKTALGGNSYSHPCESRPSTPQTGLLCAADSMLGLSLLACCRLQAIRRLLIFSDGVLAVQPRAPTAWRLQQERGDAHVFS